MLVCSGRTSWRRRPLGRVREEETTARKSRDGVFQVEGEVQMKPLSCQPALGKWRNSKK